MGTDLGCRDPSSFSTAILGSVTCINCRSIRLRKLRTFLASFFALRCFAADAFSLLFRNRTGTRFEVGSTNAVRDNTSK